MRLPNLTLTIVLLILACSPVAAQTQSTSRTELSSAERRLVDTQWRLASFAKSGAELAVVEGTTITLNFGANGRATGSGGCNSYAGEYREQGAIFRSAKSSALRGLALFNVLISRSNNISPRWSQQISSNSPTIA